MKPSYLLFTSVLLNMAFLAKAQTLVVPQNINLTKDTVATNQLIKSLNGFLSQIENPNKDNTFVAKDDLLEMSALMDEFKGMESNEKLKDDHFYKPTLTNVAAVDDSSYLLQIAYLGIKDNQPILRASFRLFAKKQLTGFSFYATLKVNTRYWHTKTIGNITFHFREHLDITNAKLYLNTVKAYDKRLDLSVTPSDFYFFENSPEIFSALGLDYKADYVGKVHEEISARENGRGLKLNGGYTSTLLFDPHDLWHERLRIVLPPNLTNRPVNEGCAYLYGGSWGISWPEILKMLKNFVLAHPKANWVNLYINSEKLRDNDKPIFINDAINALIVRKLEKENGFTPVMNLLRCGSRQQGDENYFKTIETIIGIKKANYNTFVDSLIKE